MNHIQTYLAEIGRQRQTGKATEHTYRPALQTLLAAILPQSLTVTNEPKRQACGSPDYVVERRKDKIPIGYVEAKNIGDPDLEGTKANKEQFDRYKNALDNTIYTDYLDFLFYRKHAFLGRARIGEIKAGKIIADNGGAGKFISLIQQFGSAKPQAITSAPELAKNMAGKAGMMRAVFKETLAQGGDDNELLSQMKVFEEVLIQGISQEAFADLYAQTITYGMFAARLHDKHPDTFSRLKAAELIPETNPFLRKFFQYIAGFDLDKRIDWIVDDLAEIFRITDVEIVLKSGLGELDPIFHFYENFLSEYDPNLRKARGVYYTPPAIVSFIVRAVDEILQKDFKLPKGLTDWSMVARKVKKPKKTCEEEKPFHKVQILDPATGTGTFLAEAVRHIHKAIHKSSPGMWIDYVKCHLIPRINGFELLMAPYSMAHLEMEWLLKGLGYSSEANQRLNIYLTNSLEYSKVGEMFIGLYRWLANEAEQADMIKENAPVMVVMGNPPYSGESINKGEWITALMADYKKEPGFDTPLANERNIKWINDDYVKFIRLGQYFIEKNTEGILAYINNHGFIDNPTFRGMRYKLMQAFDEIYILDLHGNAKKKETAPDGGRDENVFNIQQGVSINIFVKAGQKKNNALAKVFHHDLYGLQDVKYEYLDKRKLSDIPFAELRPTGPEYFFVPKDSRGKAEYEMGFSVAELFTVNSTGIVTARDEFTIHESKEAVQKVINDFLSITDEEARQKYNLGKDVRDWSVAGARKDLQSGGHNIVPIAYRPFDIRFTRYSGVSKGFHCNPRRDVMRNFVGRKNVGLVVVRRQPEKHEPYIFCTNNIISNGYIRSDNTSIDTLLPLYLYTDQDDPKNSTRMPNLNQAILDKISNALGLQFEIEKTTSKTNFAPIDLLDYIYAVLHSPSYREKYKEFLKTDFPRVPYPADAADFRRLATLGSELRRLHLMEHPCLAEDIEKYPYIGSGDNVADKLRFELDRDGTGGKAWINEGQCFDNVPLVAWEFYIGGYQPAQKWLKDRKGRTLTIDDIIHYQKIIAVLMRTREAMREIDV